MNVYGIRVRDRGGILFGLFSQKDKAESPTLVVTPKLVLK